MASKRRKGPGVCGADASAAGTVTEILCKVGESGESKDLLVRLGKA